ncbi:MAG TPA: universal stress protein [Gammaproteobacteria bacterium]|nr:universal stress protein [Gammaproteobacteria bacterium]
MPFKTLLMPIRDSDTSTELMETGLLVAKRFNAHLDLLYVRADPREMLPYATLGLSSGMKASVLESAERAGEEQGIRLESKLDELCKRHGVPRSTRGDTPGKTSAGWLDERGLRNELIGRLGRLADAVIMPRPMRVSPPPSSFEAAVRETGRPVIMVPRKTVHSMLSKHVAIGWNNSKEAAQAMVAAVPCLREAESVTVMVTEKRVNRRPSADEVVVYLKCHGISAKIGMLDVSNRSVGEALLAQSKEAGVDLLVVGGYSRSRLRDVVMGGVTTHLLKHAELPVLMYH